MMRGIRGYERRSIAVRQLVGDVRFADDQGVMAGTEMGLQRLMNKLNLTANNFGVKINV